MWIDNSPKISIIIPIYNCDKYLSNCIESILCQSYENIELILVNDGSTDNSLRICQKYRKLDTRVILISKENKGVSNSRNIGIHRATGDYIAFVDGDDVIAKNMYEILMNRIIKDESDGCVLIDYTIYSLSEKIKLRKKLDAFEAIRELFLLRFPTSVWAYLYKTKFIIHQIRFSNEIYFFEDFEFNFRYLILTKKISLVSGQYYYYTDNNSNSINHTELNKRIISCLKIYDNIAPFIGQFNKKLYMYAIFFQTHFLISIIIKLSDCLEKMNKKYLSYTQKYAYKILWKLIKTNNVPVLYKIVVFCFYLFPIFTLKMIRYYRKL